ncbi:MAG: acetate--CoA ligase family protein, partial [Desulfobacterales bacterium]
MDFEKLLNTALARKEKALNEHASKQLMAAFDLPLPTEAVAADEDAAVRAADQIGYPVVLKALGASYTHKTEAGLVHLNLP